MCKSRREAIDCDLDDIDYWIGGNFGCSIDMEYERHEVASLSVLLNWSGINRGKD